MTNKTNGTVIALVVILVIMALFAFRSVFFLLPFGVLPGGAHMGPSVSGWFHSFGAAGRFALFLLPAAFIVLWGAVLLWVYRDAEKRGMSGILWLLLVLIGNVIGLLIYAIVRSERPVCPAEKAGEPQPPANPSEACPSCGRSLSAGYVFCPYCGKSLKRTCPACGKPVEGEWKVCPVCGTPIDPGAVRKA